MKTILFTVFAAFFLSACGGGGGNNAPSTAMTMTAMVSMSQTKDCNGMQISVAETCPSSSPPMTSRWDTEEFRRNSALREMGALYAYENDAHGQGVTIFVTENDVRHTHNDLSPNIITLAEPPNGVGNEWNDDDSNIRHGTNVAGLLAAMRSGGAMHGIAPSVKMVFPRSDLNFAHDNDIPIINASDGVSFGNGQVDGRSSLASITMFGGFRSWANRRCGQLCDSDVLWVAGSGNDRWNTIQGTINAPNIQAVIVEYRPNMEDNLIIATAVDRNTIIADYAPFGAANGCGRAMRWCIAAFGDQQTTTDSNSDTDYRGVNDSGFRGTSASTPYVSGALALLKSFKPEMQMTEIRLILLETATPLYADATKNGVRMYENGDTNKPILSSVYGWGLVNISAGISHLREIQMQMAAIENIGGVRLGDAAKAAAAGNKFAPAVGESFRFWGGLENENKWAGIATKEYGGISAFGEYGESDLRINSFLSHGEIRGVESESWTAGFRYANM